VFSGLGIAIIGSDVTNEAQVAQAIEEAERALGPIDMLVTCAGMPLYGCYFMIFIWM
jgi:NAD(P)-dependent dehydrogenase (short-subunit alcohol dehydrogenase family)